MSGSTGTAWQRQASDYEHGVRTQADPSVPAARALEKLMEGNKRYVQGEKKSNIDVNPRQALAQHGQLPFAAIVGCADSRCPVEIMFDANLGDLFVVRNAGNTCTHTEGSMVGSLEYCVGALHTKLVLVVGHTKCGAVVGATAAAMGKDAKAKTALETVLKGLAPVAKQAAKELGQGATNEAIAAHAIKVNVFHTVEKLLYYSKALRDKVASGEVEVQGAIYDIVSGDVDFLGPSPRQDLVLDVAVAFQPPEGSLQCGPCEGA